MVDNGYSEELAKNALRIMATKLNPEDPFQWASGFRMPIYNDNRLFLFDATMRSANAAAFRQLIRQENIPYDIIAGTSTAGISPATTLADKLATPLIYIRDKPKDHGMRNRIEGIDAERGLEGRTVVLIEDLISFGGSSASAVQAIRDAEGKCDYCLSIFTYGLDEASKVFSGELQFDKTGAKLNPACNVKPLLTYDVLLRVAKETGYINSDQVQMLEEWRVNPTAWGEKQGFPKVEKK
jgi:orotate phosphoribosyltransferase